MGAVLTPLIVILLLSLTHSAAAQQLAQAVNIPQSFFADSWRLPFLLIGVLGILWAVLWLAVVRKDLGSRLNQRDAVVER